MEVVDRPPLITDSSDQNQINRTSSFTRQKEKVFGAKSSVPFCGANDQKEKGKVGVHQTEDEGLPVQLNEQQCSTVNVCLTV